MKPHLSFHYFRNRKKLNKLDIFLLEVYYRLIKEHKKEKPEIQC